MIEYFEEQLDLSKERITELEKNIAIMQENITTIAEQLKDTQMFLIKLAKNQADVTKRVSQWPFITVSQKGDE